MKAYLEGEVKRRKNTCGCQNRGKVLCLRHRVISFREKKMSA